ncbi:hypothetical protein [Candidatus Enterococcus clewellii]|uniref:Uncharacterized protein n=1 Tax=Candidatus Enterococcus clewellii TaxID=1834193 RepID=A0A242JWR7_9ENTE|nr:hypothetical protein [Enterococcus sp. 9E7_DIV0242]OTP09758.1 hypothetical protein A5888_003954 [Enterococcus sp. 9E7_DIV0242]
MDKQDLKQLKKYFNEDKKFIKDGYYRLRDLGNSHYELAFLEAGPCGDTTIHPQITIDATKNELIPIKLLDLAVSPTLRLTQEEHKNELCEALEQLLQRFYQVIEE